MYVAAVALTERAYGKPAVSGPEPEPERGAAGFVQYLSADERAQLRAMMEAARARAARTAIGAAPADE